MPMICRFDAPHACYDGLQCICILDMDHDDKHMCEFGWVWEDR